MQNIYNQATAKIHFDKLVSDEFPTNRGVRQGDPLSPKLFTAVTKEVFKKADISEGINVDGKNLTNLRFADEFALFNVKKWKALKLGKSESWPRNTQEKDKIHDKPCRQ